MARRKKTKSKRRSRIGVSKKSGFSMGSFVDTQKLLGMGASAFLQVQLKKIPALQKLDPKIQAGIKIIAGQYLPNMQMAKNTIKSDSLRNGIGDGLIYDGVKELLSSFGIAGIQHPMRRRPKPNEFLAVSVEGLDDPNSVSEDILAGDEMGDDYEIGDDMGGDDLSAVNEDILAGDDDISSVNGDDDISSVNEDILGDDMGDDLF